MANIDPRVKRLIIQRARKYKIDPAAALAVAMGEGGVRWGAVGDNGTSFGPFQLRIGGANPHKDPKKAAAFANSAAGVDYALRKMSESGAAGLKGEAAVNAIVRRFERPADPDTSVSRAVARLGKIPAPKPTNVAASIPGSNVQAGKLAGGIPPQAMGTLNDIFAKVGLKPLDIVGDLPLNVPGRTVTPPPMKGAAPAQPPAFKAGKMPKVDLMLSAITKAQQLGLRVSENSYVDTVDPVHVRGSDHYKTIGRKGKKRVSAGVDVSGDPKAMRAFFQWAEQYAGRGLNDLFFDPVGYSYDRGKKWGQTIGNHSDHVHFSV